MTTISSSSTNPIHLKSSSSTNPIIVNPGVTISVSTAQNAVYGLSGTWTIVNNGSIASANYSGIYLYNTQGSGGVITNAASASISGYDGININSGVGTIVASGGMGTVVNYGRIAGSSSQGGTGVILGAGGSVTNQSGGNISGNTGVDLTSGGSVINAAAASIAGGNFGVVIVGPAGSVINHGYIVGTAAQGVGIVAGSGGEITNAASASIKGTMFGVDVSGGGTVTNAGTIIGNSGTAVVFGAGYANQLVIDPGATFAGTVNGGNADGSTAVSTLELASAASTGTLTGLGSQYVNFNQVIVDAGAHWLLQEGNTADTDAISLAANATLDVTGTIASSQTILFSGSNATLAVESGASIAGAVGQFATGDTIDLRGVAPSSVSYANGVLDYTAPGGGSASFDLALSKKGSIQVTTDGANGANVTPLCFCVGTLLATPSGEVPVERLAVGDHVLTASGTLRRIVWIGAGKVLATRGRRSAATPVIVRKGALADNVPHHDLHLTKGHALWFDGVLIPVEFLVNHRSVLWDDRAQEVSLYHVEVDHHDVLLANGAPAESYRDDGNRWLFSNANSGWGLPALPPCAPVLTGGPVVDGVWRRLLDRAGERPGVPVTDDPSLHLQVDGLRVRPAWRRGDVHVFRLAGRPGCARVVSRSGVPDELGLARDPRPLGVALRRVLVRQGARLVVLEADDPRLTQGFHGFEPEIGVRWTDGDAVLPSAMFEPFSGLIEVELHLGGATLYPVGPAELAA